MKWLTLVLLFFPATAFAQAQPPVDLEKERAELLRLHRSGREAHF